MDDKPTFQFTSESVFPTVVSTDRLRFEKLCYENIEVHELYKHLGKSDTIDEEARFVSWEPHESLLETKKLIDDIQTKWRDGKKAGYIVRATESSSPESSVAGFSTLTINWDRSLAEMGLFLRKRFWGRGYSYERAEAFVQLLIEYLDIDVIEVSCAVENERAKRSIEKYVDHFGGDYVGKRYNMLPNESGDPIDCHLYTITREHYRSATGDS